MAPKRFWPASRPFCWLPPLLLPRRPLTRIRGTITAIDGKTATIATREARPPRSTWPTTGWWRVTPLTMADIKQGGFVGIASLKGSDGSLNALEVQVPCRHGVQAG